MKIIGLRIEKYIGKQVTGHILDLEYDDAEFEKHIICAILSNGKKVEIELSTSKGVGSSGWTTASYGHMELNYVKQFKGYTHVPKKPLEMDEEYILLKPDDYSNEIFEISLDGGDEYYPTGFYKVNMNLFKKV